MKFFAALVLAALFSLTTQAQQKPTDVDKSPLDVSYCPSNYPILKLSGKTKEAPTARLLYSRPSKNGRIIFGNDGIVKYGEMWRLGANEATEIELFKNVKFNGKALNKGRYTLYCIPEEKKWTLIVSKDNYSWGNYSYNQKNDVVRTEITVEKNIDVVESFTMYFEDGKNSSNLIIMWDNIKAIVPISY